GSPVATAGHAADAAGHAGSGAMWRSTAADAESAGAAGANAATDRQIEFAADGANVGATAGHGRYGKRPITESSDVAAGSATNAAGFSGHATGVSSHAARPGNTGPGGSGPSHERAGAGSAVRIAV